MSLHYVTFAESIQYSKHCARNLEYEMSKTVTALKELLCIREQPLNHLKVIVTHVRIDSRDGQVPWENRKRLYELFWE